MYWDVQGTKAKALGMKLKLLVKKECYKQVLFVPALQTKKINGMGDLKKKNKSQSEYYCDNNNNTPSLILYWWR